LTQRLTQPHPGDDLFVRRHAVTILGENLLRLPALRDLFPVLVQDPSPFVRQAVVQALRAAPLADLSRWMCYLAREDPVPQVRATALLEAFTLLNTLDHADVSLDMVSQSLQQEADAFVLRVGLKVASDGLERLLDMHEDAAWYAQQWYITLLPLLSDLHTQAQHLSVRRWAAQARERMWCAFDPQARQLRPELEQCLAGLKPGCAQRLPRRLFATYATETICRVLSVLAQNDFGYDIQRGMWGARIVRGHLFCFRLWRAWHEFCHPSPDKRQAFRHTIGRMFYGQLRIPSGILSELAETKVPGEPLFMETEGGWRPYLPLVDEVHSSLDRCLLCRQVRFFTSEGITELVPPKSLHRRIWAKWRLTYRFADYARLRNWQEQSPNSPASYLRALAQLGFRLRLVPYEQDNGEFMSLDPQVMRFFPAGLPLLDHTLWLQFQHYFKSFYENSLFELTIFLILALMWFVGSHLYANHVMHQVRRRLPLVLGGWGTRGKSGTERLKAALINASGYGLVSKTTGCEAMFLYAPPFCALREMFLFRPYDKATIWEQYNLVCLADQLGTDVFLWECMALNPAFVKLLQHHWMRDDIATLTNTYPDHEDIQGPAGINIPQVMTNFITPNGVLVTSEEQMYPILQASARELGTPVRAVGWLEAGLIAPDILQRFPYEEHPFNIALVLAMADELGMTRDFALKEMADRVVPDLGVLKAYPVASVKTRRLEFVNGMSANERFGCLSNWTRMGFDRHDPDTAPGVWISTVVNNRADRVARSQVFASILVADIRADRHFLIGNNLSGLMGYIQEAWQCYAQELTLWPSTDEHEAPHEVLVRMAHHMHVATHEDQLKARLCAMLEAGTDKEMTTVDALLASWHDPDTLRQQLRMSGLDAFSEQILDHVRREQEAYEAYQHFAARLCREAEREDAKLDEDFRELLWGWFHRKIVIIEDYHATGNQVIERICHETPPGYLNRVMGLQNIKGTGLGFVYCWQAWEKCYQACLQLRGKNPQAASEGLRVLSSFHDYNVLCMEYMHQTLDTMQDELVAQNETFQAYLVVIASNLEDSIQEIVDNAQAVHRSGFFTHIVNLIEDFLDAGDAVRRRKKADKIYKDLRHKRISQTRAVSELQALTGRQKGGWLMKQIQSIQSKRMPRPRV
jgi:poly-gamma-glutamate synthase PgsB/CapB